MYNTCCYTLFYTRIIRGSLYWTSQNYAESQMMNLDYADLQMMSLQYADSQFVCHLNFEVHDLLFNAMIWIGKLRKSYSILYLAIISSLSQVGQFSVSAQTLVALK